MRPGRRLRRLPRRLPAVDSARCAAHLRARLSLRLARDPRRRRTFERRARLRAPRARVRAPEPPLARALAPLHPVPARRGDRGVARRTHLGGASDASGDRRLDARRGAGAREGRDRDAELRHRADAAREPLPRRRCRPHRSADGREGAQPRDRRREGPRRGDRRVALDGQPRPCSTRIRRRACVASGAPSTSRTG